MAPLLAAENVTKSFGGLDAVKDFTFRIHEGAIDSIIGPNGAGKTTFFNCVTGFYVPTKGEIHFDGHEIEGMSTDRITRFGISRTYQNIRLFSQMTAIENILVGEQPRLKTYWLEAIIRSRRFKEEEGLGASGGPEAARIRRSQRPWGSGCPQSSIWRTTPAGDGQGAGGRAEAAAARRAHSRNESK